MTFTLFWYDESDSLDDELMTTDVRFAAQSYELRYHLGVNDNRKAEELVSAAIAGTELADRVVFDSEHGCFFAYTAERSDMEALAELIEALVDEHTEAARTRNAADLDHRNLQFSDGGAPGAGKATGLELSDTDKLERAQHHFARRDYWDFMTRNAEAQLKALTWFRHAGSGYPGKSGADTPEAWNQRLTEMIDGWQAALDRETWDEGWSTERIAEHIAACEARFAAGMAVYTEWYFSLWD